MLRLTKLPAIFFLTFALLFSFSSLATVQTAYAESHVPIPPPPTTPPGGGECSDAGGSCIDANTCSDGGGVVNGAMGCSSGSICCTAAPIPTPTPTPSPGGPSGGSDYELLAPIPGTDGELLKNPDLVTYLNSMYRIVIGLAGVLAVLMIVIGGIEYIFSALPSAKSDAKNRITGAVLGLILILIAWIILNTINPYLLDIGINLEEVGGGSFGDVPTPGGLSQWCYEVAEKQTCFSDKESCDTAYNPATLGCGQGVECTACKEVFPTPPPAGPLASATDPAENKKVQDSLATNGVFLNNNGKVCTSVGEAACTSVGGIGGIVTGKLVDMQNAINPNCKNEGHSPSNPCEVVVTGGTEWWGHRGSTCAQSDIACRNDPTRNNTRHRPGGNAVDIRNTPEVNNYLNGSTGNPGNGTKAVVPGGGNCTFESSPPHWHCTF